MNEANPPQPTSAAAVAGSDASHANWLGVASLTMGVFALVTTEFLPASLLTAIASDLGVTDGAAGQAVTATALVGAIAAPSIPMLTRRLDRRFVMLALTVLLIVANVMAATASSLPMLLTARVILGVSLGGFWSMVGALTLRLVPESAFARAMAVIFTGVSAATVCAAPIGAWMGGLWGWRSPFVAASVISVVTLAIQLFAIPSLPPRDNPSLRVLFHLLGRRNVRVALLTVLLVVSGHIAGFTYIRPLMEGVTHLSVSAVSGVLLAFGIGGFLGNFAGGYIAERSERHAIASGGALIAAISFVLWFASSSAVVTAVGVALWGFAFGAVPIGFQTWIVRAAPDQTEAAGGLLVAAFQIAIASGAAGGGVLVDHIGALGATIFCAITLTLGTALALRFGPRTTAA
jgi:DHA1 family purine ribonucleoside efflux pump-like MFS transporter